MSDYKCPLVLNQERRPLEKHYYINMNIVKEEIAYGITGQRLVF